MTKRTSRATTGRRLILVWVLRLAIPVLAVLAWQRGADAGWVDSFFFSDPNSIWKHLVVMTQSGELLRATMATLQATLAGFALGVGLGVPAGLLLGRYALLDEVASPLLAALNSLPRVALAPMFILWFGIGSASKIFLAASLVFFIVMVSSQAGVKAADEELKRMARVMGATERQNFLKIVLPGAVPAIFGGLRLGVVYSLLGVIVGEMLAARVGLGQSISLYAGTYQTAGVFATLLVLGAIGLVLNDATVRVENRLLRWQKG